MTVRRRTRKKFAEKVELVHVDQLIPDDKNPRKPDPARLGLLRMSIAKLGFLMPVYRERSTQLLLSGHQRLTVTKELGRETIPVQDIDVSAEDIMGINVFFNRRLEVNEPVVTPQGWKAIGDVEVGDFVAGLDGGMKRVTHKTPVELRQMFKVTFDGGEEILADEEHLWTVRHTAKHGTEYGRRRTIQTSEVADILQQGRKVRLPQISAVDTPTRDLPVDPWLLGILLGDGSLSLHGVRLHTSAPIEWVENRIRGLLPDAHIIVRDVKGNGCNTIGLSGSTRGGVMDNPLLDKIRSLGLDGTTGTTKFVPEEYLWASIEQRVSLLQGLMDSDGCAGSGGGTTPVYTTTSEALADAVRHLTLSLGGKASKRVMREAEGEWSTAYQVTVRLPAGYVPFTRPDRVAEYKGSGSHRLGRFITKIEAVGEHEAVCISIDSDDHLYLTRDFIPTHNCTNDFNAFDTGGKGKSRINMQEVIEKLEALPDSEHDFAIDCKEEDLRQFSQSVADQYDKKAVVAAYGFMRKGIRIPVVVSESGTVVNGVFRLLAAVENDAYMWPVVRIPDEYAEVALILLNYLSMDFHVDDDFKDLLRAGAYRRPSNNRGVVPKSYRFWANGCRTLLDRDSYTQEYWINFRQLHGNRILDFGGGLCKVAPYLRTKGFEAVDFEPYLIDPDSGVGEPCPLYSRQQAKRFLEYISDPDNTFDSIFMSAVMNSVPFPEDRLMILSIVNALSCRSTKVFGTCRDISDFNYEYGGIRNAGFFVFDSEPGVRLGDAASRPKIQKFFTEDEARSYLKRFWLTSATWPGGNIFYFQASNPMGANPEVLSKALEFEFDLPFRDGSRMGLVKEAKAAFSKRLGKKIK